jgi:uncharacterized membrane protein YkvA (DUF1232 family)
MPQKKRRSPSTGRKVKTILDRIDSGFVESGARTITHEDVGHLVRNADEVLAEFAKGGALRRFARDVGPMVSIVRDYWDGTYRDVPCWTVAVITFTLGYVLKPVDIIPDTLPVIGRLDDAVVVGHGLDLVRHDLDVYRKWTQAKAARS